MNQTAQGLASLGRGNDSMLVHMTPREVQGLQGLAMAHGGSLTINPKTGLPEAGFLDAILPMAAGFALGPGGFGLFSSPLMAGLAVGGVTALTSGDLGKGLMAGLGAGSGFGLGKTFAALGQNAVGGVAPSVAQDAIKSAAIADLPANVAQNAAQNLGMFNSPAATATMGAAGNAVPGAALSNFNNLGLSSQSIGPGVNSAVNAMGTAPTSTQIAETTLAQPLSGFGASAKGIGKFMEDPLGKGFEAYKVAGGEGGVPLTSGEAAFQLGSPVASVALSSIEPPTYPGYQDPELGKYKGPQGQLNLSDRFDTGLRLIAKGGYIKGYALGGAVNPNPPEGGGLSDLYNRPEGTTTQPISSDGYGIGRLNNLAGEQSRYQAQTLGYADGGDVVASDKGMNLENQRALNLDALPTLNVETGAVNYMTPDGNGIYAGRFFKDAYRQNPNSALLRAFRDLPNNVVFNKTMAKGGYLDGAGDGMSDSIPATIEGKQPARLADGEFVVPADVVSHLGNGSSKAGSKRLYAMLDKVRQARTGNKKQGKEIKAEKYLPKVA